MLRCVLRWGRGESGGGEVSASQQQHLAHTAFTEALTPFLSCSTIVLIVLLLIIFPADLLLPAAAACTAHDSGCAHTAAERRSCTACLRPSSPHQKQRPRLRPKSSCNKRVCVRVVGPREGQQGCQSAACRIRLDGYSQQCSACHYHQQNQAASSTAFSVQVALCIPSFTPLPLCPPPELYLYCCAQNRCSLLPGATSAASAASSSMSCGWGSPTAAEAMAVSSYSLYRDA